MSDSGKNYNETIVPFTTRDGIECNLIRVQGDQPAPKGPVLLVHGAGVRAEIFRAPVETNIVDYLVANGYEPWLENWRASIDVKPNNWNLDQAALYDHPEAVRTVVKETGWPEIKAIIHCQGSTGFMMSTLAGLVPQVKTIISNAVSLHTVVPSFSRVKLRAILPAVSIFTSYLSPQWGIRAPTLTARVISLIVRLFHHECDNEVCKQVSFMYGTGFPALWKHENLNPQTHEWLKHEFAFVPVTFYKQMARCVGKGNLVSMSGGTALPRDFAAQPPKTDARFSFFAGRENLCFLPQSQVESYKYFNAQRQDFHSLHVIPAYSHLDIFMGQHASRDVFPLMLLELNRT
jgi:hypothetical protein